MWISASNELQHLGYSLNDVTGIPSQRGGDPPTVSTPALTLWHRKLLSPDGFMTWQTLDPKGNG